MRNTHKEIEKGKKKAVNRVSPCFGVLKKSRPFGLPFMTHFFVVFFFLLFSYSHHPSARNRARAFIGATSKQPLQGITQIDRQKQ
jgi:hypothetical protein